VVKTILYKRTIALGMSIDLRLLAIFVNDSRYQPYHYCGINNIPYLIL